MPNLSESDRHTITARIRELRRTGNPMEAHQLIAALNEDRHPPANLMGDWNFRPEKDIAVPLEDLEVPPRAGRGASKTKWAEFALVVADVEPEIIAALDRDEIIGLLEARGIIGEGGEGEGEVKDEGEVEVEGSSEDSPEVSFETADGEQVEPTEEEAATPEVSYDPNDFNVDDVLVYAEGVTARGAIESLIAMESAGKNRSTLIEGLTQRLVEMDAGEDAGEEG